MIDYSNPEITTIACPNCTVGQLCGFCNNTREIKYIFGTEGLAAVQKAFQEFKERERKLKYQENLIEYYRAYGHLHVNDNSPVIKPKTKFKKIVNLIKELVKPVVEKLFKEKSKK